MGEKGPPTRDGSGGRIKGQNGYFTGGIASRRQRLRPTPCREWIERGSGPDAPGLRPYGFDGFGADEAYANGGGQTAERTLNASLISARRAW